MLAAEPTGASYMSSEFQTEQAALEFTSGRVDWAVVGARDAPTGHRARVRRRREIQNISEVNISQTRSASLHGQAYLQQQLPTTPPKIQDTFVL